MTGQTFQRFRRENLWAAALAVPLSAVYVLSYPITIRVMDTYELPRRRTTQQDR